MPHYAALIEYDGTAYFGFQRQREGQPTIQSDLERALAHVTQKLTTITGAGRTDRGVHALGQVITFAADWRHGRQDLKNALNANLPEDIVILQLKQVPATFHPRFDAQRRAYRYVIVNNDQPRSPNRRRHSWHVQRPLHISPMNQAAQRLVGRHDFATFGRPPQGENTVRTVFSAGWRQQGDELHFMIEANAFLQRMVRSLAGSLKLVGEGTWTGADFVAALAACDRARAGKTAPPQGLTLISVAYDEQYSELFDVLGDSE